MRTNESKILENIIKILANIDLRKSNIIVKKGGKTELYDYLIKEFLNIKEYKVLISN